MSDFDNFMRDNKYPKNERLGRWITQGLPLPKHRILTGQELQNTQVSTITPMFIDGKISGIVRIG